MKVLELFSGTHSIGVVCKNLNYDVVSLDRDLDATSKIYKDYTSTNHIKEDILKWDYKKDYKPGDFDIITASPVCCFWSIIRNCWIGRTFKNSNEIVTRETLDRDMIRLGAPMVDRVFEIIEYFKPKYYWIENPKTSKMWKYIKTNYDYPDSYYLTFDYCKYSDFGYKKPTTFLTNIPNISPKICNNDCENMEYYGNHKSTSIGKGYFIDENNNIIKCDTKIKRQEAKDKKWIKHRRNVNSVGGGSNRLERYRIPLNLIEDLLSKCV